MRVAITSNEKSGRRRLGVRGFHGAYLGVLEASSSYVARSVDAIAATLPRVDGVEADAGRSVETRGTHRISQHRPRSKAMRV